jgi:hypothetical protein
MIEDQMLCGRVITKRMAENEKKVVVQLNAEYPKCGQNRTLFLETV